MTLVGGRSTTCRNRWSKAESWKFMSKGYENWARQFADSVIAQNAAIQRHDPTTGNEFARRYIEASEAMISGAPHGLAAFARLLGHENLAVRVMAASYLLPHRPADTLPILEEAAKGKGITALGAKMTD